MGEGRGVGYLGSWSKLFLLSQSSVRVVRLERFSGSSFSVSELADKDRASSRGSSQTVNGTPAAGACSKTHFYTHFRKVLSSLQARLIFAVMIRVAIK